MNYVIVDYLANHMALYNVITDHQVNQVLRVCVRYQKVIQVRDYSCLVKTGYS